MPKVYPNAVPHSLAGGVVTTDIRALVPPSQHAGLVVPDILSATPA